MTQIYFTNRSEFRKWLEDNHSTEKEISVIFYKVTTGKPSMTWSESVDEALCFGLIDSIRRSVDNESYCIRFTPRNPKSIWSKINIEKVEQLSRLGLMQPAGLIAFEKRNNLKSGIYSFENENRQLEKYLENIFMENLEAWQFFLSQPPSYKKMIMHWIYSAKQEKTKLTRLQKVIAASYEKRRIF